MSPPCACSDVARDGEAEARVALVLIARLVESIEGPEGVLALVRGDAGPVVVDVDVRQRAVIRAPESAMRFAIALRVADEIGEAAAEGVRPHRRLAGARKSASRPRRRAAALRLQLLEHSGDVRRPAWSRRRRRARRRDSLRPCAPSRRRPSSSRSISGVSPHQRERQLEAGDDGAQIMRDAVQHGRALLHGALDAAASSRGRRRRPAAPRARRAG